MIEVSLSLSLSTHFTLALSSGLVGLTITYAISMMGLFEWVVRLSAEVENQVGGKRKQISDSDALLPLISFFFILFSFC